MSRCPFGFTADGEEADDEVEVLEGDEEVEAAAAGGEQDGGSKPGPSTSAAGTTKASTKSGAASSKKNKDTIKARAKAHDAISVHAGQPSRTERAFKALAFPCRHGSPSLLQVPGRGEPDMLSDPLAFFRAKGITSEADFQAKKDVLREEAKKRLEQVLASSGARGRTEMQMQHAERSRESRAGGSSRDGAMRASWSSLRGFWSGSRWPPCACTRPARAAAHGQKGAACTLALRL